MPIRPLIAPILVLAGVVGVLTPPTASADSGTTWAYCFFEASGGVGTQIALIVTEPFEVAAKHNLNDVQIAREYDELQGIANLVPGYQYFMSISGTDCRLRASRAEAKADVEAWRATQKYTIVRVVAWKPSAKFTMLGGGASSGTSKPGAATVAGPVDLGRQARERVAKAASSPETQARNNELARRRAEARRGSRPAKPSAAQPAVVMKPTAMPGATLYWMCHYWNHPARTSYYSSISSALQDKSVTIVQEELNYRKAWVAHLQKMGLNPGAGGTCTGMHVEKDIVQKVEASKIFYVGNYNARTVDTGWPPSVSK